MLVSLRWAMLRVKVRCSTDRQFCLDLHVVCECGFDGCLNSWIFLFFNDWGVFLSLQVSSFICLKFTLSEGFDLDDNRMLVRMNLQYIFISELIQKIVGNTSTGLAWQLTMSTEVVAKLKRPANVPSLCNSQPELNQGIKIKRARVKFKEVKLCKIQTCMGKGIAGISRIVPEAGSGLRGQHSVSVGGQLQLLLDLMLLLVIAHKGHVPDTMGEHVGSFVQSVERSVLWLPSVGEGWG